MAPLTITKKKSQVLSIQFLLGLISFSALSFLLWLSTNLNWIGFAFSVLLLAVAFTIIIKQISLLSECRVKENTVILKNLVFKTQLMPIECTEIKPMMIQKQFTLVKINFAVDGIYRSLLVITNRRNFDKMKKRQAISRVL